MSEYFEYTGFKGTDNFDLLTHSTNISPQKHYNYDNISATSFSKIDPYLHSINTNEQPFYSGLLASHGSYIHFKKEPDVVHQEKQ